nr:MAG TPA: hypothetical protein [Caudoviricetes sp.]
MPLWSGSYATDRNIKQNPLRMQEVLSLKPRGKT